MVDNKDMIKMYHYTISIPNSVISLVMIPAEAKASLHTITGICANAGTKLSPIALGITRGNAYDDGRTSYLTFSVPKTKSVLISVVEELIVMMTSYISRTATFDETYAQRSAILAKVWLQEVLYIIRHSKYSVSYVKKSTLLRPFYKDDELDYTDTDIVSENTDEE